MEVEAPAVRRFLLRLLPFAHIELRGNVYNIETQSKESKKALVVFKCKKCGLQRIQPQEPLHDSEKFRKFSPYLFYGDEDTFISYTIYCQNIYLNNTLLYWENPNSAKPTMI